MLDFIFGFNARMGRLAYFGVSVAVGIGAWIVFTILLMTGLHPMMTAKTATFAHIQTWPMMVAFIKFTAVIFLLHCMRVRDIGWDPVCVIPLWIAAILIDCAVATYFPEWAIRPERFSGTIAGALLKIVAGRGAHVLARDGPFPIDANRDAVMGYPLTCTNRGRAADIWRRRRCRNIDSPAARLPMSCTAARRPTHSDPRS